MTTRQEIVTRIKEFVREKGWTVQQFADKMQVARNTIYVLYSGVTDPQVYFLRLGEEGCDLNWLRTGERTTGASSAFLSNEQALLQGFPEEIGTYTLEDLRSAFAPDITIEQLIALAHEIGIKAMKDAHQSLLSKKKQPKKKDVKK